MRFASGVVDQYKYFVAVDATDLKTRETGLASFTVVRSRNGAADATFTTPTIVEIDAATMPGVYALLLDEDMTIDAGDETQAMAFHITHAGMDPVTFEIELYRPKITAGNTLGVEADGDLTKVNTLDGHTAQTGDSFARLGAPAGASVSADVAAVKSDSGAIKTKTDSLTFTVAGHLDANLLLWEGTAPLDVDGSGFVRVTLNAAGLATDAVTEIQSGLSTLDAAGVRSALGLAAANLDTQLAAIDDAVDTEVAAIKAKTDQLTFTVAGQVDANIQYANDVQVKGTGTAADPWNPV